MITTLRVLSDVSLKANLFVFRANVCSPKCLQVFNNNLGRRLSQLTANNLLVRTRFKLTSEWRPSVIQLQMVNRFCTVNQKIEANSDPEKLEKEKQRQRQQKITKYTLLAMMCMFCGSSVYALLEWGKPMTDADGKPIPDRFSDMPLVTQYFYRAWDTLTHYEQVLREPTRELLLPPPLEPPYYQPPYTLVLEMTGILVNPEWTYKTGWRFKKRPFVDYFLQQLATSGNFEIVIYTYEQGFTAFPLLDSLDPNGYIMYRLFRDSTRYQNGVHLKDLNCLNRDLNKVIHIDWNPGACQLNSSNCLTLKKWDGNSEDRTLYDLTQFLTAIATESVDDVRQVIQHYSQFDDPIEAFKENQRKLAQQQTQDKPKPPPLSTSLLGNLFKR